MLKDVWISISNRQSHGPTEEDTLVFDTAGSYFFSDGITTENGQEMSTRKIKVALREAIEKEDKSRPLSDEALTALLKLPRGASHRGKVS